MVEYTAALNEERGSAKYIVKLSECYCVMFINKAVFDGSDYSRLDNISWLGNENEPNFLFIRFAAAKKNFQNEFKVNNGDPMDFMPAVLFSSTRYERVQNDTKYGKRILNTRCNVGITFDSLVRSVFWIVMSSGYRKSEFNDCFMTRMYTLNEIRFKLANEVFNHSSLTFKDNHKLLALYRSEVLSQIRRSSKYGIEMLVSYHAETFFFKYAFESNRYQGDLTKLWKRWSDKLNKWMTNTDENNIPTESEISKLTNELVYLCIDMTFCGGNSYSYNYTEEERYLLAQIFIDFPRATVFNDFRHIPTLGESGSYGYGQMVLCIQQEFMSWAVLSCILTTAVGVNKVEYHSNINTVTVTFDMRNWFGDWNENFKINYDSELLQNLIPYIRYCFAHAILIKKKGFSLTSAKLKADLIEITFDEVKGTIIGTYHLDS